MRNTGLSTSIGLIAMGAILAWAVTFETNGINIKTVGLILFAVGILGIVVTLAADANARKTVIERNHEVVVSPDPYQQQPQQQVPAPQQAQPQVQQPQVQQPQVRRTQVRQTERQPEPAQRF